MYDEVEYFRHSKKIWGFSYPFVNRKTVLDSFEIAPDSYPITYYEYDTSVKRSLVCYSDQWYDQLNVYEKFKNSGATEQLLDSVQLVDSDFDEEALCGNPFIRFKHSTTSKALVETAIDSYSTA